MMVKEPNDVLFGVTCDRVSTHHDSVVVFHVGVGADDHDDDD